MSHTPKLTLIGMYNYDETLFTNLNLPSGIDRGLAIDTIRLDHGEQPVIYTDPDFMKIAIGVFSRKWYNALERINLALQDKYNPLHNYDRYEEYTDKENTQNEGTVSGTTNETDEDKVSAYNATTYQPSTQGIRNGSTSGTSDSTGNRKLEHEAHLYGNIGVTTSQQMLEAEVDLRRDVNIYKIISDLFYQEFIVPVY